MASLTTEAGPSGSTNDPQESRIIDENAPEVPESTADKIQYALQQMEEWKETGHTDEMLLEDFRTDFGQWKEADIEAIERNPRGRLRTFLRDAGIYTGAKTSRVTTRLFKLLESNSYPEWPQKELDEQIKKNPQFRSRHNHTLPGTQAYIRQQEALTRRQPYNSPSQGSMTPLRPANPFFQNLAPPTYQTQAAQRNVPRNPQQQAPPTNTTNNSISMTVPANGNTGLPENVGPQSQTYAGPPHPQDHPQGLTQQQPPVQSSSVADQMGLQNLRKGYRNENMYSGRDLVLDDCIKILMEQTHFYGISLAELPRAFPVILTGEASKYYYRHLVGSNYTLPQMIATLKTEFESKSKREDKFLQWSKMTLIREQNKPLIESFEKLKDDLQKLRSWMRPELQTDEMMRDKLYAACLDIPECDLALKERKPTFQQACDDIRYAVKIKDRDQKLGAFTTHSSSHRDGECETCYTERKFKNTRSGHNSGGNGRFSSKSPHPRNFVRSSSTLARGRDSNKGPQRCWICKKEGHYSNQHSEEEQAKHRSEWRKQNGSNWSDNRITAYATTVEGVDPDISQGFNDVINAPPTEEAEDSESEDAAHWSAQFMIEAFGEFDGEELFEKLE